MYIAIDIGGTKGRVAGFHSLVNPRPAIRKEFSMARDYESDAPVMWKTIEEVADGAEIKGIGVGTHGAVDPAGATITASGKLAKWHHHPITADLKHRFGVPVKLVNDAYAAAMSEAVYGQIEKKNFWFLIWGTGVGGSYVAFEHGKPQVRPGELGHQRLDFSSNNIPDGCGHPGCMESLVSGGGIEQNMGKKAEELTEKEWQQVCEHFAQGVYNLMAILPTDYVVVGGGVAIKQAHRLSKIEDILRKNLEIAPVPKVSLVTHGDDAGLIGALGLLQT